MLPFQTASSAFDARIHGVETFLIPDSTTFSARKITEAKDQADVLIVADPILMDDLLASEYPGWYIAFASDEIVIAYTDASRNAAHLTPGNWFELLSREETKVAAVNPAQDPCGYWTELCWKLADRYYDRNNATSILKAMTNKCGQPSERRGSTDEILQLLESSAGIDYGFVLRSQALQHHLPSLRLPPEISLGEQNLAGFYRQVSIRLPGKNGQDGVEKRGEPIAYGFTIPRGAKQPDWAVRFLQFLLDDEGRKLLSSQHVTVLEPAWTSDLKKVPTPLQTSVAERTPASRPASSGPVGEN